MGQRKPSCGLLKNTSLGSTLSPQKRPKLRRAGAIVTEAAEPQQACSAFKERNAAAKLKPGWEARQGEL